MEPPSGLAGWRDRRRPRWYLAHASLNARIAPPSCVPVEAAMLLTFPHRRSAAADRAWDAPYFSTFSVMMPMSGFKDEKSATVGDIEQLR
jgi:hypothetical protein